MSEQNESTKGWTTLVTEDSGPTDVVEATPREETVVAPSAGSEGKGSKRKADLRQEKKQERRRQRDERATRVLDVIDMLAIPPTEIGGSGHSPDGSSDVVPVDTPDRAVSAEETEADHRSSSGAVLSNGAGSGNGSVSTPEIEPDHLSGNGAVSTQEIEPDHLSGNGAVSTQETEPDPRSGNGAASTQDTEPDHLSGNGAASGNGAVSTEGTETARLFRQNGSTTGVEGTVTVDAELDDVRESRSSGEIVPERETTRLPADVAAAMTAEQGRTASSVATDPSEPGAVLDPDRTSSAAVLDVVAAKKLNAKGAKGRRSRFWARLAEPKARPSTTTSGVLPAPAGPDLLAMAPQAAAPLVEAEASHPDEAEAPHLDEAEAPHPDEAEAPHPDEAEAPHLDEAEAASPDEAEAPHPDEAEAPHLDEAEVPSPGGTDLVRTGTRQVWAGARLVASERLESLRRVLPGRARTVPKRRLALVLALVVAAVLVVAIVAASALATSLAGPTTVVPAPVRAAVINATPGGVGTISPAPQHVASIGLDVQGVIAPIEVTAVDVFAGQVVAAGAPLLQLNPLPFEQNNAQVYTTLLQAEQTLASAQAAANGTAGATGNAYLAVQVPTLEGQVAIDQQLLQIAEGNSSSLTAPIAGYVSNVRITPGQAVNPGSTLLQIVDPSQVQVSAGMQLSDLQSIAAGDQATITPSQLPGVHLHGTVVAVSPAAANGGLEGTVVVSAPNLPGHPVPIGSQTFVSVSAPVQAAVSVPALAVLNTELNPVVAVVHNGHVHFQPVVLGATDGTRVQILSGLHAGQTVAVSNLQSLTDGSAVVTASGGA